MKSLVLLRFMAFLLLALDASESSLLAFGSKRTKKLPQRKTTEAPYICLDPPIDLPSCNFASENDEKMAKTSRNRRALGNLAFSNPLEDYEELSSRENTERDYTRALTIVYKIEGCIPSRLPFVLPICQRKDSTGRIVEVRRLFPFKVLGNAKDDPGVPLVFPELDMNEWQRFMKGPWTQTKNEDDVDETNTNVSNDSTSQLTMKNLPKLKKFDHENKIGKKTIQEKFTLLRLSKNLDETNLYPKFPSSSLGKTKDHASETSSYKLQSHGVNSLILNEERKNEKNERTIDDKVSLTDYRDEFPYEKAIPYDPKKLVGARLGSEFPYTRAIPYDAKKLGIARLGSEFPYTRAIPYDAGKLGIARLGSEFPYTRAIPYDAKKLQTSSRGSEFPYARAIPYDPKKLEERKNESMERSIGFYARTLKTIEETREENFRDVPFDTSMLAAAKEGGTFPYVKDIPDDTSISRENMKFPSSKEPEKIKVPVRQVMTFWSNNDVPSFTRKLQMTKETSKIGNIQNIAENNNILNDEKIMDEASWMKEQDDVSLQSSRVARGVIESSTSDVSSMRENLEIPRRWSEFPYSRAIPFDPEKLRRLRSLNYENSVIQIPRDFPYARAIPYDPWKLTAMRRKKNQSIDKRSIYDESKRQLSRD